MEKMRAMVLSLVPAVLASLTFERWLVLAGWEPTTQPTDPVGSYMKREGPSRRVASPCDLRTEYALRRNEAAIQEAVQLVNLSGEREFYGDVPGSHCWIPEMGNPGSEATDLACALNLSSRQVDILVSELRNALVPALHGTPADATRGIDRALRLCDAVARVSSEAEFEPLECAHKRGRPLRCEAPNDAVRCSSCPGSRR